MSKRKKCVETYYAIKLWPRAVNPYFMLHPITKVPALYIDRKDAERAVKEELSDQQYSIKKVTLSD